MSAFIYLKNCNDINYKSFTKCHRNTSTIHNLDIVSLINHNPVTKLTNEYQTTLMAKLTKYFTTDEHNLFLSSFFCYMNYDTEKDFVIDLDKIWKWLDFSRKDVAKRLLEKEFEINTDYKVENLAPHLSGASFNIENQHGGQNKENILMTIDTFKIFSLSAKTSKAKEIRKYYVKLEKIVQETLEEQAEDHRKQLQIKDQTIKDKSQEVKDKIRNKETNIINNLLKIVYAGYVDLEKTMLKFGYTNNVKDRLEKHKKEIGEHFTFEIAIESKYNIEIEKMIKSREPLNQRIIKTDTDPNNTNKVRGKMINGKLQTEIIKLDEEFKIEDLEKILLEFKEETVQDIANELEKQKKKNERLEQQLYKVKYIARHIQTNEEKEFKSFTKAKFISGIGEHAIRDNYMNKPNHHKGFTYREAGKPYWESPLNFKYIPDAKPSTHSFMCKSYKYCNR